MGWRHKLAILPLAVLISFIGAGLFFPNNASAASLADAVQCQQTLRFTDMAHMVCQTSQGPVIFTDRNPSDEWDPIANIANNSDAYPIHYAPNGVFTCPVGNVQSTIGPIDTVSYLPGISLTSANVQDSLNISDRSFNIKINIGYSEPNTNNCVRYGGSGGQNVQNFSGGTENIAFISQFSGNSLRPLTGVNDGRLSEISYTAIANSAVRSGGLTTFAMASGAWQNCSGNIVVVQHSGTPNSGLGVSYELFRNNSGTSNAYLLRLFNSVSPQVSACDVRTGPLNIDVANAGQQWRILGQPPTVADIGTGALCQPGNTPPDPVTGLCPNGQPPTTPANPTTPDPSCESSWRDGLEWLFCTALRSTDRFLAWLVGIIERQLFFDADKFLSDEVYRSWSVFRNIAASLLVIIMLLIIISQALSWGPFDAYTVRRVLPRLVAAAILIPLSWPILYFVIGLFNDIGQGIASLMFFPFGGEQNMTLSALLGIDINDPSVNQEVFLGLTVAGGLLAVAIAPFAALGLAWLIVPVIVIGFLVLALREILIVMAVILAPIAIVLWILPGTRKFWNLWQETLEKLLIMFPLIMGLIATGRIFASIAGNNQTSGLDIIAFLLIVVGVFGPLLMIPKTFQWGGQILNNMTGAINNRSKGVFDRPRGFLQGRQKMQNEYRDTKNAQRSAGRRPYTRGPVGWVQRGVVAAKSGRLDPTLRAAGGQQAVDRKGAEFLAKVPRAMNEAVESQKLRLRLELDGLDRPQILERLREYSTDAGSSDEMVRASADMMREQKDKQGLQHMQRELAGQGRGDLWNSIKNANFGDFRQISPDLVEDYTATGGTRARVQTRSGTADMPITFAPLQDKLNALASVAPGTAAHQRMTDDLLAGFRRMDDSQRAGMSADAWHEALTVARASGSTEVHESLQRIQVNENLTLPAEVRAHVDTGRPLEGGTPVESHAPFDTNRPYNNPRQDASGRANPRTPADYV